MTRIAKAINPYGKGNATPINHFSSLMKSNTAGSTKYNYTNNNDCSCKNSSSWNGKNITDMNYMLKEQINAFLLAI